jgi:hypothetical protein
MTAESAPRELPAYGADLYRRFDGDRSPSEDLVVLDVLVDRGSESPGRGEDGSHSAYNVGRASAHHLPDRESLRIDAHDCRLMVGRHEPESDTRSERTHLDPRGQDGVLGHDA